MKSLHHTFSYHTLPRLYSLFKEGDVPVNLTQDQAHYLCNVMRLKIGDQLRIFNEKSGEYLAEIEYINKNNVSLFLIKKIKNVPSAIEEHPIMAFGIIKKESMHTLVEKAVELGVSCLEPLLMEHVQIGKIKEGRLDKWALEAVEQSEHLCLPMIEKPIELKFFLKKRKNSPILWACERGRERQVTTDIYPLDQVLESLQKTPVFLVGPEGGFSEKECHLLKSCANVVPIDLGENILRTETACLMMLSCYRSKNITS